MITFAESVAAVLRPRAAELATRWLARARAATPRRVPPAAGVEESAGAVVGAVVACLERDAQWQGEVMRRGWADGAAAHAAGLAVHHVLKDADLLVAVLLTAAEDAAREGRLADGTPADAIGVARRVQRAVGLYAQAAASSYLHALVTAARERWRTLRHDLRNPLGTIRSALSLMEDEALPPEARTGPRIRAMVSRNAGSIESLIAARLGDAAAEALVTMAQDVSLRDVAVAVRRTLRDAISLAECEVVVDDALPWARVDEAAVELTLTTLLLAGIARARPGDVLRVAPGAGRSHGLVVLRVHRDRDGDDEAWDADGLALSTSLAAEYGGRVSAVATPSGPSLDLELPLLPGADAPPRRAGDRVRASAGHLRDDVSRAD